MASRARAADLLALAPAAAIPFIFLHRRYQPHASFGRLDVFGSDVAILVVLLAALAAGVLLGLGPLARPRLLWALAGALLALLVASCFWTPTERLHDHLVSVSKIVEYALLAPALVLLFRRRAHVDRFLAAFVAWSAAAAGWGLLQFFGVVSEFEGKRPGQREPSFLGIHDLGAVSGASLAIGLAGIALAERRRLTVVAVVAGAIGAALAASIFAYAGIVLAAAAALLAGRRARTLTPRRALALAGIVVAVGGGVLGLRSYDATQFLSFLGDRQQTSSEEVQTGSQRTMLAYIGMRIWLDHPVLGIGFGRSTDRYEPYLADARREFPNQPEEAYPSPEHRWGVQNLWIQLLADVGVVGLVLAVATFVAGIALALRAQPPLLALGLVAAGWLLVAAGTWNALGIVAGIPLQAVTWLGLGLAATVVSGSLRDSRGAP